MTYKTYAIFPEASYLVATGNDPRHCEDFAERVLKQHGIVPYAVATVEHNVHKVNAKLCSTEQLLEMYGA